MSVSSLAVPTTFHTMVDDTMEIASEHGHNIVEEDIDIDIDLTTGHVDEDDILDDVDADADFDTNITDVPAHVETDDLMLDDDRDDASYHMEDADLLEEEADDHNMEQEPAGLSLATDNPSGNSFNEVQSTELSVVDAGVSDQFWDDAQVAQELDEAAIAQDTAATVHGSEDLVGSSADSVKNLNTKDTRDLAPASFPHSPTDENTQSNSPQNHNYDESNRKSLENNLDESTYIVKANDPNVYAEDEEHLDLNTAPTESAPIDTSTNAEDQGQERSDLNTAPAEKSSSDPNGPTLDSSKDLENQHHAREIVVKYNDRSYPLIRKYATDHPNEFFFEDPSVVEKPFNEFCSEIRKVLMEENLPKDDKISLVIEELQLVIEESQLTNYPDDLSLGQIIRLYERLVNNDGTGEIPPLNLRLIIQPTGYDRFLALSNGAAEGKGLLDFVTWDAESEDDQTEFEEPTEHDDSQSPSDGFDPELEEKDKAIEAKNVYDGNSNHGSHDERPHPEHADSATSVSAETPQGEQDDVQREVDHQQLAPAEVRKSPSTSQKPDSEIDEDGDFIDYEDEEDIEKPLNDGALEPELPVTDESRPQNEEESRRNSVSLKEENTVNGVESQVGDDETTHTDDTAQPEETFQDVESDIDYEEENADDGFNAEGQEGSEPNGLENAENGIKINATNDEDREYALYDDNNEIDQTADDEGLGLADTTQEVPHDVNNETEDNGDGEGLDLANHTLEVNNVDISYNTDLENGEHYNFDEDEFDLGVGDEEETDFLQNYQQDDEIGNNELLRISVAEDATTTNISFDDRAAETDSATISNASTAEVQGTKPGLANGQDQEDEIDYDDDEEDPASPVIVPQSPTPKSEDSPVSNSGKRPRAETDFEDGDESITNEAKRIRS
ncbi:1cfa243e-b505-47b1-b9c4-d62d38cb9336 [Sclerotinia trifoliorum]|uniref:1cfa243e-b505-47b1-b9c4-d62d38cb9336 n=1 Tax=Sclerotinia trifoliorum TaxID=28548 RepID=A0A8H2ZL51_9HELO|nr:1cfa243e-b505-47b1-b9c4-d62d38cb9336 [Sclerotinia trifoliorum]